MPTRLSTPLSPPATSAPLSPSMLMTFALIMLLLVSLFMCATDDIFLFCNISIFRSKMPEKSIPEEAAYQVINDELMLNGNPRLNLASFVTTWMEPECDKLIMSSINKNYVDMDEYPVTTELQVGYLRDLFIISFINFFVFFFCFRPLICVYWCPHPILIFLLRSRNVSQLM